MAASNAVSALNQRFGPASRQKTITASGSVALEILDVALMFLRCRKTVEGAQVAALAGFGVLLARLEPVLAASQFADHDSILSVNRKRVARAWVPALMGP